MRADRLWMEEDDLRSELDVMDARLFLAAVAYQSLLSRLEDAAREAYVAGYSDAVVRISGVIPAGDQGCVVVH